MLKPAELTPLSALRLARARARGGHPRGRRQRRRRPGLASSGSGSSSIPTSRRSASPARPRSGAAVMQGAAGDDQARDARARRQVGERRLRGRRPRARGRRGAVRRLRQRRPGLLRPLADPRRALRLRPLPRSCSSTRPRRAGRRSRGRGDRDGPAHLGGAPRDGRRPSSTATSLFRGDAPTAPASGSRHARRGVERRPRRARGGLRPGRGGDPVRRRGRRDPHRQRHAVRALGLDLDARRRAGAARRARASRPACSRSTRTRPCACRRRSAASSSRASAASSGCTALDGYSEVKNVFISTEA